MAVVFNADALQRHVKFNLRDSINYLNSSISIFSSIDIPTDFKYSTQLKNYPQNISNIVLEVKNTEKWLNEVIINFKNIEKKNAQVTNEIETSAKTPTLSTLKIESATNALDQIGAKIEVAKINSNNSNATKTKSMVSNMFNWVASGKWLITAKDVAIHTGAKIVKTATSGISLALSTGAKAAKKVTSSVVSFAGSTMVSIGSKVSSVYKWSVDHIVKPGWSLLKSTSASVTNIVMGVVKGLCQLMGSLLDCSIIIGTGVDSIFTGIYDGITYTQSVIAGNSDNWSSKTKDMWKLVMGFVSEDHVDNVYKSFYQNNIVGQWLDQNAPEWFKSDGVVTNIASGIGYVSGILGTLGLGKIAGLIQASLAVGGSIISGIAGIGKYTGEYWAKMRDSSWEGIERFYEKGQISKEQYNSYKMIRSLDENQWKSIENDFKNGTITKEQYEQIKQIRELPEDWTTLENALKGLGFGISNGAWESIQWYVGAKLAGTLLNQSQAINSAIRVGVDTSFNASDTFFRTATESIASGEDWEQAWLNQGGWQSVLLNTGIGLAGSAGGEAFDIAKIKKGINNLNTNNAFKNIDKSTADKVKIALMNDYISGKIDLSNISKTKLNTMISKKISSNIHTNSGSIVKFFEKYSRERNLWS